MFNRDFINAVPSAMVQCWPALSEGDRAIWNQLALFLTAQSVLDGQGNLSASAKKTYGTQKRDALSWHLSNTFLNPLHEYDDHRKALIEAAAYFNGVLVANESAAYFKAAESYITSCGFQQKIASAELKMLVQLCADELLRIKSYYAARRCLAGHILSIPIDTEEQIALKGIKQAVLDEVAFIFAGAGAENSLEEYRAKMCLITQVMTATAKNVPGAEYNGLIVEISKHEWGKNLASVMSKVIPIALFAACAALVIATGGLAAPAILGLGSVVALLVSASVTGGAGLALAGAGAFVLWKQKQANNMTGKMTEVIASPAMRLSEGG